MRGVGLDLKRRPRFMAQGSGQGDIKALGGQASCGFPLQGADQDLKIASASYI